MTQPRPRIGLKIRRAMERKRLDQGAVADALGVSRSAVNAWINDRAWPANSIGALEDLLDITLDEETVAELGDEVRESLREQVVRLEALARQLRAQLDEEEGNGHDETPRLRREA